MADLYLQIRGYLNTTMLLFLVYMGKEDEERIWNFYGGAVHPAGIYLYG